EQQMLSLAQAFIAKPKLLMIDELSLGLAPTIVERLLEIVGAIHDQGATVILVEQSVNVALRLAKRAVFMEKGEVRFEGPTTDLLDRPDGLWPALTVKEALAVAFERQVDIPDVLPAVFGLPQVKFSEARIDLKVEELIDLLGLAAFRDKFVSELSTGSRRMVEIGAILAHEPRVLLLDEPSSGIAQKETEALGPLLRQVQAATDCSILIIEHDMPLITSLADRIVALESGAVLTVGPPQDLLA